MVHDFQSKINYEAVFPLKIDFYTEKGTQKTRTPILLKFGN